MSWPASPAADPALFRGEVLARTCRVRTTDEVLAALDRCPISTTTGASA